MAKKSAVKTKTAKKPAKKKPVKKPTLTAAFGVAAMREIHKWKSHAKRLEFDVKQLAIVREQLADAQRVTRLQEARLREARRRQAVEPPSPVWPSVNGRILMREMTNEHLQNAICYAQRRLVRAIGNTLWLSSTEVSCRLLADLLAEATRRGLRV